MNNPNTPRFVVSRGRTGYLLIDTSITLRYLGEGNDDDARESFRARFLESAPRRALLDAKAKALNS